MCESNKGKKKNRGSRSSVNEQKEHTEGGKKVVSIKLLASLDCGHCVCVCVHVCGAVFVRTTVSLRPCEDIC